MATLASWNDSEFANATFTAGKFVLQGSTDGSAYGDHATAAGAAALTFTAPFSQLSPTDVVGAPFAIRLGAGTTNSATVTVTAPSASGDNASHLTYSLVETATFGCDKTTTGTKTLITDAALGAGTATFTLTKPAAGDGTAVNLCFKVTAKSSLVQDKTATGTWLFTATSTE